MSKLSHEIYQFYQSHDWLFNVVTAEWFTVCCVGFMLSLILANVRGFLGHMGLVGLSAEQLRKARELNRDADGKRVNLTGAQKANLDHPPKGLYFRRRCYQFAEFLVLLLGGAGVLFYLINVGALMLVNDKAIINLLLSEARFYPLFWLIGGVVVGSLTANLTHFWFLRDFLAKKDAEVNRRVIESRSKHKGRTGELSDARSLQFASVPDFNPTDYFNLAMAKDAVFLGLDEQRRPITLPRQIWVKSNIQIMGSVGSGKGVLACGALAQCARNFNDAVIVFDPKNDEFAPHVLHRQTDKFLLLDLRQGKPAQLNIFRDLSAYQLNELLVSGFSLGRRGDNADFYRDNDRQAVRMLSSQFEQGADVAALLEAAQCLPQKVRESASGFMTLLQELCSLSVLQTREGVDLKDFILNGGCLYVVGSLRDESVIMLQKMLFVRCLQIIEERDRLQATTHVNIFLDEFKYLLSKSSLEALGTVRDKNCNILLTHQSLGDFGQCGADMKPEVAQATVIDNTPIKWIYRMKDYKVAEWVSKQTGQILVDSERRNLSTETGNVELMSTETTVFKEKRELIDTNTIQHLPDGAALMIGVGLARIAYSKPIKTVRRAIALTEYPPLKRPDFHFSAGGPVTSFPDPLSENPPRKDSASAPATQADFNPETDNHGWR
ncbi:TraM recognition domain-containing protein [Xenorhabdus sp. XENO-10]|uniref:TraM recognition domain-containing protein n=1 Tax=Xenorhabdus yunnanensis TaxID=3025878 RepID=A0ABT5LJT6_9GAMM|nr:TraM recognition domain-containing protein [Xenorhabdus yunnanensis]MDC9591382.1 TraM recognition domain-containing protein [Xenorhabdus yunnanensis]